MKETVYLVVSQYKVERMTKNLPSVGRGEIPVKLDVIVDPGAFREPVLTRKVEICDWRDNIEVEDLQFDGRFITEEEAAIIRARRLAKMAAILKEHGYDIAEPGDDAEPQET